jgi:uncharacterized membrane protein
VVVGTSADLFGFASQAFLCDSENGIRPFENFRQANSINNAGQIAGQSFDPSPDDDSSGPHALLWDPTDGIIDLGTVPDRADSRAADVNELGQVVGSSGNYAFLWHDGALTTLDSGGLNVTSATSINNEGTIIGFSSNRVALVWDGGTLYQLNDLIDPTLGWQLEYSSDINDRGQIVGWGRRDGFGTSLRAFLLTPIAEPNLPGDYNQNGTVDTADYVVWRKGLGTIYTQDDYDVWRARFGASLGSGSGSSGYPLGASAQPLSVFLPEPAGIGLLATAALLLAAAARRRQRRQAVTSLASRHGHRAGDASKVRGEKQ